MKRNNFFSRTYHQLTTRYNVYFNGNQALKSGEKNMEDRHREDYTTLLPVFVSNDEQTRGMCAADMDYAIEKAAKAIDKHSITVKPRRRRNKDSKNYQTFRKKKEFNNQLDKCYLLLGKAYFYKKKYAMANSTFRFIERQYADDEELLARMSVWMFRSLTEDCRYDEAKDWMGRLEGVKLKRSEREMVAAAKTDYYIRQGLWDEAVLEAERLVAVCRSMKRRPRYYFILSQLYLKVGRESEAMSVLKKATRFNFNYEMVFNAKINMALAYQEGDAAVEKKLDKMLHDARNSDYKDRIYYALGNIKEKQLKEEDAIELYWQSVRASVDNENQKSLSFKKLGDYYFKERDYIQAQHCYDSCMYAMDSRHEDYEKLKVLLTDLTELAGCLNTMTEQDSLLKLAALPEVERNRIIDAKIQQIKEEEERAKELERQQAAERYFFDRNDMINRGNAFTQTATEGDWYFYNPMTVSLGKNEFKRKWGTRKLEDDWRRQSKVAVELEMEGELVQNGNDDKEEKDIKSREYYLQNIPLTEEARKEASHKIEDACYRAGELYLYTFNDPEKALECFDIYIGKFKGSANLPMVYYLACTTAEQIGETEKAENYKRELIAFFPDSDFAKGIQNPDYFKEIEDILVIVENLYSRAFDAYTQNRYPEAEQLCDEILSGYPDNKLSAQVLFLKAMCVLNLRPSEGRDALMKVLDASPSREIKQIAGDILASIAAGETPVAYTLSDMDQARYLQANRNWAFDEDVVAGRTEKEQSTYQKNETEISTVVIVLPEEFTLAEKMRFKARMIFINAAEAAEGKSYQMQEEELWYKSDALVIKGFTEINEAKSYLNRVATDKHLLKLLSTRAYRMFFIDDKNFSVLKRMKNLDDYVSFFAENYYQERREGEIVSGMRGTLAHLFHYGEEEMHDCVLAVPFREVNTKHIAEILHRINPAFVLEKGEYDNSLELVIVKKVGSKSLALDYMNSLLRDKELYDLLAGIEHEMFLITSDNLRVMQEGKYLNEYMEFFTDNYIKNAGEIGVEYGDYVYNKSVAHAFVLIYPNTVDPFKLKEIFEDFNYSGLTIGNKKFDDMHDYMIISGFEDKTEAMRYFNTVVNNRKLFKSLRNADYTNFIITQVNMETLLEKGEIESYLDFFKKYYLN